MAERVTRCRPLLGTFIEVTGPGEHAIEAAFGAIARVHALMSGHDPASKISELNRFGHERPVTLDPWTGALLERALFWARHSEGAFDMVRAGKAAAEHGALPIHPGQPHPEAAHWTWLELTGRTARLMRPGCIDVGGIAKGFAVDRAIDAMKSAGASFGLVNAGGDMAGFGSRPWPVHVVQPDTRRPLAEVEIDNTAIATSSILPGGDDRHLNGREDALVSATVCGPAAADCDALAKVVLSGSAAVQSCLARARARAFALAADGSMRRFEPPRKAA